MIAYKYQRSSLYHDNGLYIHVYNFSSPMGDKNADPGSITVVNHYIFNTSENHVVLWEQTNIPISIVKLNNIKDWIIDEKSGLSRETLKYIFRDKRKDKEIIFSDLFSDEEFCEKLKRDCILILFALRFKAYSGTVLVFFLFLF